MAHIVLINPKFEISFWGLEHALPLIGKRANMPVAALPLIAAVTPDKHRITIIDENVEPIDFELCGRADIVGVTGMIVQKKRIREILGELRRRGVFTVVGGPWVSVNEAWYDNWPTCSLWARPRRPGRSSSANGRRAAMRGATSRRARRT